MKKDFVCFKGMLSIKNRDAYQKKNNSLESVH